LIYLHDDRVTPDLRTFPTRRSSDLYQSKEMDGFIDGAVTAAAEGDRSSYEKNVREFVDLAFTDIPRIPLYQPYVNVAMQKNVSGDRKSTRLNSSHVKISYAVFCLKK